MYVTVVTTSLHIMFVLANLYQYDSSLFLWHFRTLQDYAKNTGQKVHCPFSKTSSQLHTSTVMSSRQPPFSLFILIRAALTFSLLILKTFCPPSLRFSLIFFTHELLKVLLPFSQDILLLTSTFSSMS